MQALREDVMRIAVILFAYKRPEYLKRALATHRKIKDVSYYAFVDHSEIQKEIIEIIHSSEIYDVIIPRHTGYGLDKNITEGITETFAMGFDAVIVLEDDLLLSRDAFYYLINHLILFERDKNCGSVSLYGDEFYNEKFKCWGWATWWDRWNKYNYVEGGGTQATQFHNYHLENNLYCKCSVKNRVNHIGKNGEHYKWYSNFGFRPLLRKIVK